MSILYRPSGKLSVFHTEMKRTVEKNCGTGDLRWGLTDRLVYLSMYALGLIIFVVSVDVLVCSLCVRVCVLTGHFEGGHAGHMEKTMKQSN